MFFGKDLSKIAELAAQSSETRLQRFTAEWIAREIKAAQQSVQWTAFGVGLAFGLVGMSISIFIWLSKFGCH